MDTLPGPILGTTSFPEASAWKLASPTLFISSG
jgi:hypothetical protein